MQNLSGFSMSFPIQVLLRIGSAVHDSEAAALPEGAPETGQVKQPTAPVLAGSLHWRCYRLANAPEANPYGQSP